MKNLKILITVLLSLFILDYCIFEILIWKLPNESPWGTNHFFNFIYEKKSIENRPKLNKRILIIGSSIAYYSIDKKLLEEKLRSLGKEIYEVDYLSYAGMTPLDAYLLKEQIFSLKPDMILYPINFIDFRMHRAYVLDHTQTNENSKDKDLLLDALHFEDAPQSKFAFPKEALKEFILEIPIQLSANFLAASLFKFYKYREIYFSNLKNLVNHRFGRNTSYHGYAGIQIPERVNALGWTSGKFSFETKAYMYEEGFYIQVVPEILQSANLKIDFSEEIKSSDRDCSGNRVGTESPVIQPTSTRSLDVSKCSLNESPRKIYQSNEFKIAGWQNIVLTKEVPLNTIVTAKLNQTWKANEAKDERHDFSEDILGVRLQQTFGLDKPNEGKQYFREERSEDLRYKNMSFEEYKKYFEYRLLFDAEHRPGIRYIWALKNAKERLSNENFRPTLHFQYLQKFTEAMNEKKIPTLIINNPENPIALGWYENSNWYKKHLQFMSNLQNQNIRFYDFKNKLNAQMFSDFHHVTYSGMENLNDEFVKAILESNFK